MGIFKEMMQIAALLGEENEQRLKDAVTDAMIRAAEKNIAEWMNRYYMMDFRELFSENEEDVKAEVKKRIMKRAELNRDVMAGAEHCVVCGDVIPEGRQVCPKCERGNDHGGNDI